MLQRLILNFSDSENTLQTIMWKIIQSPHAITQDYSSINDPLQHTHKKRKDSLETRTEPAVFSLWLEFRKLLKPSPHKPAWNINKKLWQTTRQFKVKGLSWLSLCFVLNLSMSGESRLIFNWHNSRAASGISFFTRVPTKDEEYSINWRNNIVAVITCYLWHGDEGNLKKQIKNRTFWVELSSRKNDLA